MWPSKRYVECNKYDSYSSGQWRKLIKVYNDSGSIYRCVTYFFNFSNIYRSKLAQNIPSVTERFSVLLWPLFSYPPDNASFTLRKITLTSLCWRRMHVCICGKIQYNAESSSRFAINECGINSFYNAIN